MLILLGFLILLWGTINAIAAINEANNEAPAVEISENPEPPRTPPKINRVKLEQIAANCLAATNCSFDTYYYLRNKSDIELMDIIKDFNLKYNYE